MATFTSVPPSATAYSISVDGSPLHHRNGTGSVTVAIGPSDPATAPVVISEVEIAGTVTLSGAGTPVVTIAGTTTTTPALTGGTYDAFVAPGSYTVTFNAAGYAAQTKAESLTTAGNSDTAASASLVPLTITVTVTSGVGSTPVVGEMVSGTGLTTTATDSNGQVVFSGVAPGSYTFSVAPASANPHYGTATGSITVHPVETSQLAVTMALSEGKLTGSVTTVGVCTATSATVTIAGTPNLTLTVSMGGNYTAFVPPGSFNVSFAAGSCVATASTPNPVSVTNHNTTTDNAVFP
jgi:hypothetical protein